MAEAIDNEYPKWMYGPNEQARIFERGDEIPEGWEDHPSKVLAKEKKTAKSNPTGSPDEKLTDSELVTGLKAKKYPELQKMAKELQIKDIVAIKKDDLVSLIAAKLVELQNDPETES